MKNALILTGCFLGFALQAQEKQDKTEFKKHIGRLYRS
jgi:hypothetical protein